MRKALKYAWLTCVVAFCAGSAMAQDTSFAVQAVKLQKHVNALLADDALENASFGFQAIDLRSGKELASNDRARSLTPASIQKLVTTASALEVFGPDHRFETYVEYDGKLDANGVLDGNIYVRGGGDPTLGSRFFSGTKDYSRQFLEEWVAAIKKAGIKQVNGRIIGDASIFGKEAVPGSWIWGDLGNYYGAVPCGLTVFDNTCYLDFTSGPNKGDETKISCVRPYVPELAFENEVSSANSSRDNAYIYGGPFSTDRYVVGSIPKGKDGFEVKGSMPDPAYLVAFELEHALASEGIAIATPATTVRRLTRSGAEVPDKQCTKLDTTFSPPLEEIIKMTNYFSVNLFAEHLINHIGLRYYKSGDVQSGGSGVNVLWKKKGIDTKGMHVNDGSGLSRYNAISAEHITSMLRLMSQSKHAVAYRRSLATMGKTGSLSSLGIGTAAQGRVFAKSGYMTRVRSYAGYVKTRSGRELAFTVMVNNYTCSAYRMKQKLVDLMAAMAAL